MDNAEDPMAEDKEAGNTRYDSVNSLIFEYQEIPYCLKCFPWLCLGFMPCLWCAMCRVVAQWEAGLVLTFGSLEKEIRKPGLQFINPISQELKLVDYRTKSIDVPEQQVMTKDTVAVTIDCVIYIKVVNAMRSVLNIRDYTRSTSELASSSIRGVFGQYTLEEVLGKTETIAENLKNFLQEPTDRWGVVVERVEIKNVLIPMNMQRAMATEAETERKKRAKVLAAQGEYDSSTQLARAADVLANSHGTMQLRFLQTVQNIAQEKNSTILFPIPIELFEGFIDKDKK